MAKAATEVLEGVVTNGTASAMNSMLTINQPVAGKTGTTDNTENLWFCGYTPQLSVAIWTGYKSSDSSTGKHPAETSNRAFAYFVNTVLADTPRADWPMANAANPTYKENSTWKFSNTASSANDGTAATTEATTEEAAAENTESEQTTTGTGGDGGTAGGDGGTTPTPAPTPTPEPEPTPDPTPTPGGDAGTTE